MTNDKYFYRACAYARYMNDDPRYFRFEKLKAEEKEPILKKAQQMRDEHAERMALRGNNAS